MKPGLYEQVVDAELSSALAELAGQLRERELDPADSHHVLAAHLKLLVEAVLARQPTNNRVDHQLRLCNKLIGLLAEEDRGLDAASSASPSPCASCWRWAKKRKA